MTCDTCTYTVHCLEPGVPSRCSARQTPDGCTAYTPRPTDTQRLDALDRLVRDTDVRVAIECTFGLVRRVYVVNVLDHVLGYTLGFGRGPTLREAIDDLARQEAER